jgi:hypothetical protein
MSYSSWSEVLSKELSVDSVLQTIRMAIDLFDNSGQVEGIKIWGKR